MNFGRTSFFFRDYSGHLRQNIDYFAQRLILPAIERTRILLRSRGPMVAAGVTNVVLVEHGWGLGVAWLSTVRTAMQSTGLLLR
jgi:hypothetical protein